MHFYWFVFWLIYYCNPCVQLGQPVDCIHWLWVGSVTQLTSNCGHNSDVILSMMVSQITGILIVCLTICTSTAQRKYLSFVSLAFVRGIHWSPADSPHKGPLMWKLFPFDDAIMETYQLFALQVLVPYIYGTETWSSLSLQLSWHLMVPACQAISRPSADLKVGMIFNSSSPSATYMRQWIGLVLLQIMAWHLFISKPLPKRMLTYCQLDL